MAYRPDLEPWLNFKVIMQRGHCDDISVPMDPDTKS